MKRSRIINNSNFQFQQEIPLSLSIPTSVIEHKNNYYCHNRILNPTCLTVNSPEYAQLNPEAKLNARYYQDLKECENDCSPAQNQKIFPLQQGLAEYLSPTDLINYELSNQLFKNSPQIPSSEQINFERNFKFLSDINLLNQLLLRLDRQQRYDEIENLLKRNVKESKLIYTPAIHEMLQMKAQGIIYNTKFLKFLRFLILNDLIPSMAEYQKIFEKLVYSSVNDFLSECQESEGKMDFSTSTPTSTSTLASTTTTSSNRPTKNDYDKLIDLIIYKLNPDPFATTPDNVKMLIIILMEQFKFNRIVYRQDLSILTCKIEEARFRLRHFLYNLFQKFPLQISEIYDEKTNKRFLSQLSAGLVPLLIITDPKILSQEFMDYVPSTDAVKFFISNIKKYLDALGYFFFPNPQFQQKYLNDVNTLIKSISSIDPIVIAERFSDDEYRPTATKHNDVDYVYP